MISSPNWRDFTDFSKFYKDGFEDTSLSIVDSELQLPCQIVEWQLRKKLTFHASQSSKQCYKYWVQYLLHLVHVKDHFLLWSY